MTFKLPTLPRGVPLTDRDGKPTQQFQTWWQSVVTANETQEELQDATIVALQTAQLDIIATQEALEDANAAIIATQDELAAQLAQIIAVTNSNAISASWIAPASVLTASDAGTDATITIANFTRFYDDGTSVAVTGGDITGLDYSTLYAVYYDDATRASTTPTLVATTFTGTARHNFAPGRHFVGTVTTPASGGAVIDGGSFVPPGGGDINVFLP